MSSDSVTANFACRNITNSDEKESGESRNRSSCWIPESATGSLLSTNFLLIWGWYFVVEKDVFSHRIWFFQNFGQFLGVNIWLRWLVLSPIRKTCDVISAASYLQKWIINIAKVGLNNPFHYLYQIWLWLVDPKIGFEGMGLCIPHS